MPTVLGSFLLTACQTQPVQQAGSKGAKQQTQQQIATQAFPEPELTSVQALNKTLLLNYLVGEIGARAGELETALQHYLSAAKQAKEPYAAERATRIALHLQDLPLAVQAVGYWVRFAPNVAAARQFAGIVYLQNGDLAQAQQQFEAMLKIAAAQQKDAWLAIASVLSREENRQAVYRLMQNLVAEHALEAKAQYALAIVEVAQQQHGQAEESLNKAVSLAPSWELPHNLLAQVMLMQGRPDEAVQYLETALRKLPDAHLLRRAYARQLVDMQRFTEALKAFRALHKAQPEDKENIFALATIETQQKNWRQARALWQQLRNEEKFHADASFFLAQVEESTGHKDLAIGLYASVTQGSYEIEAAIRQANLLAAQGRVVEMRGHMRTIRRQKPGQALELYGAEAQIMQEHIGAEEALHVYTEALRAYPNNADLLYNRGLFLADIGRYQAMEVDFRTVVELDEKHANAWNALGYTLADRNVRLDEAWDYIQRAVKLEPNSAAILDSLGWVYYRMGNIEQAEIYLRKAFNKMQDAEIAAHLGEVLWVQGKQDEAKKVWYSILQAEPESEFILPVMQRLGEN